MASSRYRSKEFLRKSDEEVRTFRLTNFLTRAYGPAVTVEFGDGQDREDAYQASTRSGLLRLTMRKNGDARIVTLQGELDLATIDCLDEALEKEGPNDPVVLVDLRGLTFIDSTGLSCLLRIDQRCQGRGGRLLIVPGDHRTQRVFELTGVERHFLFVSSPEEVHPLGSGW